MGWIAKHFRNYCIIAVIKQIAVFYAIGKSANEWLVIEVYIQTDSETMGLLVGFVFYLAANRTTRLKLIVNYT